MYIQREALVQVFHSLRCHQLKRKISPFQQAKAAAESVLDQIDTMKKVILARAFRGELGTNDPTEESLEYLQFR